MIFTLTLALIVNTVAKKTVFVYLCKYCALVMPENCLSCITSAYTSLAREMQQKIIRTTPSRADYKRPLVVHRSTVRSHSHSCRHPFLVFCWNMPSTRNAWKYTSMAMVLATRHSTQSAHSIMFKEWSIGTLTYWKTVGYFYVSRYTQWKLCKQTIPPDESVKCIITGMHNMCENFGIKIVSFGEKSKYCRWWKRTESSCIKINGRTVQSLNCLLYTSPSPRD